LDVLGALFAASAPSPGCNLWHLKQPNRTKSRDHQTKPKVQIKSRDHQPNPKYRLSHVDHQTKPKVQIKSRDHQTKPKVQIKSRDHQTKPKVQIKIVKILTSEPPLPIVANTIALWMLVVASLKGGPNLCCSGLKCLVLVGGETKLATPPFATQLDRGAVRRVLICTLVWFGDHVT